MSPLQFQKQLRLQEVRRLMLGQNLDATSAAYRVGCDDASHFNREYKRQFGAPPMRDVVRLREVAKIGSTWGKGSGDTVGEFTREKSRQLGSRKMRVKVHGFQMCTMSMQPQPIPPVPEDTVAVARAAFPKGNLYLQIRDILGSIYQDETFASLFSRRGQPAQAPWQLALVYVMQFIENLSDRQAADAVRARIDWKYALSLPLSDPGFDYSVLSEFRDRLIAGEAEQLLLDKLLEQLREKKLLKGHKQQRTNSTHVL